MARIAGVDLPRDKRVEVGIRYIYGIGPTQSKRIIAETGISPDTTAYVPSSPTASDSRTCNSSGHCCGSA